MAGECHLVEVAEIIMGQSPPGETYNETGEGLPFFQGVADFNYRFPTPRVYCTAPSRIAKPGDIMLSVRAPIGLVNIVEQECAIGRGLCIIRARSLKDARYLEFVLRAKETQWDAIEGGGSVFGNATRKDLELLHISWPEEAAERYAIAHILGTLDDKIELNRRMNQTLEDMARAIFKSWFLDFDPVRAKAAVRREHPKWTNEQVSRAACPKLKPEIAALFPDAFEDSELGESPKGWRVGTLGELMEYVVDRVQPSAFTESHPYVPIECIKARSVCLVNWQPGSNARSSLVRFRKGDIIFGAMRPYFHKVCIAPFDGTTRTTAFVLRPVASERAYTAFVVSRDETIDYATAHSEGSTIPYAKWAGSLEGMTIVIPPQHVRQAFDTSVWPLIERMTVSISANTILAAIRDTLLPKLISGEIRVKDAERFLKERRL